MIHLKKHWFAACGFAALVLGVAALNPGNVAAQQPPASDWAMKTTIIEACSCPMFCQCYFNSQPASHHEHGAEKHFCKFNMAHRVNTGHYGCTKLDGAKFWVTGDLGANFGDGEADWAVVTFDPSVNAQQREGIKASLGKTYPVKWTAFAVADDARIDWSATKDRAEARLGGGKIAEIVLARFRGMTDDHIVFRNLRYFGAPRNDGFIMMPNEVQAYRVGDKAFEYKGTTGFMITYDVSSKDVK
jgi:hypothetical protein